MKEEVCLSIEDSTNTTRKYEEVTTKSEITVLVDRDWAALNTLCIVLPRIQDDGEFP